MLRLLTIILLAALPAHAAETLIAKYQRASIYTSDSTDTYTQEELLANQTKPSKKTPGMLTAYQIHRIIKYHTPEDTEIRLEIWTSLWRDSDAPRQSIAIVHLNGKRLPAQAIEDSLHTHSYWATTHMGEYHLYAKRFMRHRHATGTAIFQLDPKTGRITYQTTIFTEQELKKEAAQLQKWIERDQAIKNQVPKSN